MKNLPDELKKQIPDKPKKDIEEGIAHVDTKMNEIDNLMNSKMGQLDQIMKALTDKKVDGDVAKTVGNVRELLKEGASEVASNVAVNVIDETIEKAVN